jgi:hypothetical protein
MYETVVAQDWDEIYRNTVKFLYRSGKFQIIALSEYSNIATQWRYLNNKRGEMVCALKSSARQVF